MNKSHLHAVVDTAVDGIILMDAGGTVTVFNPACERIFGYAAEEIVGGDVKRLMPSPYRDEHDHYLENYQRTGERKIIGIGREVVGLRKSGETFPMDLSVGKVEDDDEASYVGILRDVTERKRADQLRERLIGQLTARNEERERFVEQLAAKSEEQTYFLHAASHDLKEPLRMITAFCGRLSKSYGERLDKRGAEYLQLSIAATVRMTRLLDDLVEFGRLGLVADRSSFFNATEVINQVLDTFADPIRERRAEIALGPLPRIYGNPIRFQGLMQNLIGNAMKYVAEGVVPRIQVTSKQEGEFWQFSVSDNGIGIAPRHHEQIFEPFKRLHAKNRYEGAGLGLAICRKIVDGFGGVISVRSSEGEGSTFSFTVKSEGEANDGARI
jgi:PAS domain S-box-containing protein